MGHAIVTRAHQCKSTSLFYMDNHNWAIAAQGFIPNFFSKFTHSTSSHINTFSSHAPRKPKYNCNNMYNRKKKLAKTVSEMSKNDKVKFGIDLK